LTFKLFSHMNLWCSGQYADTLVLNFSTIVIHTSSSQWRLFAGEVLSQLEMRGGKLCACSAVEEKVNAKSALLCFLFNWLKIVGETTCYDSCFRFINFMQIAMCRCQTPIWGPVEDWLLRSGIRNKYLGWRRQGDSSPSPPNQPHRCHKSIDSWTNLYIGVCRVGLPYYFSWVFPCFVSLGR